MDHYSPYIDELYRYIFFAVGQHRETAEDLTSAVFVKALQAAERFDTQQASLRTYLYRIARNTVIDHYRHQAYTVQTDIPEDLPSQNVQQDQQAEVQMIWQQASVVLESDALQMMVLKYRNDLSIADIAAVMDKSEDAVKSSLKRSRDQLQQALHVYE